VRVGRQIELLGQHVPEIFHVGEIAALVVFEHLLENLDVEEGLFLQVQLGGWIGRIDDLAA
jgi:hypothetical protein